MNRSRNRTVVRHGLLAVLALLAPLLTAGCTGRLARVRHLTRVKIVESNNTTTRPGSVYDNITYFESIGGHSQPRFFYEFIDTGLGTAEPLYPMMQAGHQGSWGQLLPAFFSENARHIDHFTSLTVGADVKVDSVYMLRNIGEFPDWMYAQERLEGYPLIVIRLEYYTRLRPGAQGGRHRLNDPDPFFDPMQFMKEHLDSRSLAELPQEELERFEAKVSAIRHIDERFIHDSDAYPLFDETKLADNSLWYYPDGHDFDYGVQQDHPHQRWPQITHASQLVHPATVGLQEGMPLDDLLDDDERRALFGFLCGEPHAGFDPADEPGLDTLDIRTMSSDHHMYTSGVELERIQDALADVVRADAMQFVGVTIRPYQQVEDVCALTDDVVPQIRLVFQMMDPRQPDRPLEQLYLHLNYDAADRFASDAARRLQHAHFMERLCSLEDARENDPASYSRHLEVFVEEFTQRPVARISFSSSLTGIWVFGALTRTNNFERALRPYRIVREGVDVGFYSSTFDNDLFRAAAARSDGEEARRLTQHLEDLTVTHYRDRKRTDAGAIRFDRMTCAQCHQMSGRDAVHVTLNDGIDPRFTEPVRASEFVFHELGKQLADGQDYGPVALPARTTSTVPGR